MRGVTAPCHPNEVLQPLGVSEPLPSEKGPEMPHLSSARERCFGVMAGTRDEPIQLGKWTKMIEAMDEDSDSPCHQSAGSPLYGWSSSSMRSRSQPTAASFMSSGRCRRNPLYVIHRS